MRATNNLTREQEVQAFALIKRGGPEGELAREQFIVLNQPLVGYVAKRYRKKGPTWEELVSAGNVGLLQAMNRFDPSLGHKFSTFAVPWIKGEICELFAQTKKHKLSDRRIRATDNGVPLVDRVPVDAGEDGDEDEIEVIDGSRLENDTAPPQFEESNLLHPELEDDATKADATALEHLPEVAPLDIELQMAVIESAERAADDGEKGHGLSAKQAASEGMGSAAGCAEGASLHGEDAPNDASPRAGGLAINYAADRRTDRVGVDSDLTPVLEEAVERLEDPRQARVIKLLLGLGGHKQCTFAEIGKALGVSTQRAHEIRSAALAVLREDERLGTFFELIND